MAGDVYRVGPFELDSRLFVGTGKYADFDVMAAVRSNTQGLPGVLDSLAAGGCRRVLLTGSPSEPAASSYGSLVWKLPVRDASEPKAPRGADVSPQRELSG